METSLIIPTFNRGPLLRKNLARLATFKTKPTEILIIDDGSSDNTKQIAESFGCRYFYRDHPIYDTCCIPKNIGLKKAKYDIVILAEPELIFVTPCIEQLANMVVNNPNMLITAGVMYFQGVETQIGPDDYLQPERMFEKYSVKEYKPHDVIDYGLTCFVKALNMIALFICGIQKKHLLAVGGWDENMCKVNGGGGWGWEDTDMCTRLRINGIGQIPAEDIEIIHQYHQRPPVPQADEWVINEKIFYAKRAPDDSASMRPECIIANQNREWGVL